MENDREKVIERLRKSGKPWFVDENLTVGVKGK